MTRHVASTRDFPHHGGALHPVFTSHPIGKGALILSPLPAELAGPRYKGLDPSDPTSWHVRPYNPEPGMVGRLNFDGAKHQANTPMGGTWRNPMVDRKDVKRRRRLRRR